VIKGGDLRPGVPAAGVDRRTNSSFVNVLILPNTAG
jgi:hypothetical protein